MNKIKKLIFPLLFIVFACSETQKKPNIIIILADDLGWGDVGFNGSDIQTPNIDRLAQEGIILNRYYTATICSPTRAGLLTGRYPDRVGIRSTGITPWRDYGLDTAEVTLPEILAETGYNHRAILGKWHLGHSRLQYHPLRRGFTHFYGHYNGAIDYFTHKREGELDWHNDYESSYDQGYSTDLISGHAVKCIKEYNGKEPFFLYVAYNAPHTPLQAKEEDLLVYGYNADKPKFGNFSPEEEGYQGRGNTQRQTYSAMVTTMDRGIGRIIETLKDLNIEDNTLILFHSDNGAGPGGSSGELRGKKYQEWEGGVRAPAIIKWPAGFKGQRVLNQVTGYIDIVPTLREITGIESKSKLPLDGVSILPVLKNPEIQFDRNLYLGYGAIVNQHWKLIKATTDAPKMNLKEDMLFHISEDPSEKENIITSNQKEFGYLNQLAEAFDAIEVDNPIPPFYEGSDGFKAPKEWQIVDPGKIIKQNILVDGSTTDWEGIPATKIEGKNHLWLGQDLVEGAWNGPADLSYSWKTAWNSGKLFFLVEVTDDTLSGFNQEYAWLNDCLEIYIDPLQSGGNRIAGISSENTLEDRLGKKIRGYEMQFLPSHPPKVFVDDSKGIYYTQNEQTQEFFTRWQGEIIAKKTTGGYLLEIGFAVPGVDFQSGHKLSIDVAVCDDDGSGRKSLLISSGLMGEFWLTMDHFDKATLQ